MTVTLFTEKENCSGCGACMNACGQNAISMEEDEFGFRYPKIDADLCIRCGACTKACGFQDPPAKAQPQACYAAVAKEDALLERSSSGGVFAVLAQELLRRGGVVYGAAMPLENGCFAPKHIRIADEKELYLLQGSKYVQSDTGTTFSQAKEDLKAGKQVLYSGTPCQIAGLLKYLGKAYDNLLTVEVICHGVPSAKLFRDHVAALEEASGEKITEYAFRSKQKKQSMCTKMVFRDKNGAQRAQIQNGHQFSYMHYFLQGCTYRDSCYSCPFATSSRVADITLGDFWGFHQEYPQERRFVDRKGISCVLANTPRGWQTVENMQDRLAVMDAEFEKIARHNQQLTTPSACPKERETILRCYRDEGYRAVDGYFRRTCKKDILLHALKGLIPQGLKRQIKRGKGRLKAR